MSSEKPRDGSLKFFFDDRAARLSNNPDLLELCYASGREPRLWTRPELYADLMQSLRQQLDIEPHHALLEVGSAAGFLAKGLAAMCGRYTGVDLAPIAVERAQRLGIPNACFLTADAAALPFADNIFDRAVCHDVFTNFSEFAIGRPIMREMARVLKPGGKMMIGSLPDEASKSEFQQKVDEVTIMLEREFGPRPPPPEGKPGLLTRLRHLYVRRVKRVQPHVVCYYFHKHDFEVFGREADLHTSIEDIHTLNPYFGYRFNAIYTKKPA
jgi:ubiquinone/menaquinone biosynthesis C-methylase UbiE